MPGDIGTIDTFLVDYSLAINNGFGLIEGDVRFLTSILIGISLAMAGLFWALKREDNVLVPFLRRVLIIGFFAFLINNWPDLVSTISRSFVELGIKAGGNEIDSNVFFSPAAIAGLGTQYWTSFDNAIASLSGPIAFFENFASIVMLFLMGTVVIVSFFFLAVQIFVTLIVFKLVTLAAFILVPFGILQSTNFIAERALGLVFSYGVKFMVLALIVSIGYSHFIDIKPSDVLTFSEATGIALGAVALMGLAIVGPAVAGELITGGPQIGAGGAAAAIAGSAAVAGGAVYLAAKGSGMAGGAVKNRLTAASNAGNVMINGQPMSSKNSGSSLGDGTAPNFHTQSAQGGNKQTSKSMAGGAVKTSTGMAGSAMASNDKSGGTPSTGTNNRDEGE